MKKYVKRAIGLFLVCAICAVSFGVTAFAQDGPVANGIVGLTFGEVKSVISGQTVTGNVYTYDVGGTDAFTVSFQYDTAVFAGLEVEAGVGVSVLAQRDDDGLVGVVFMADPNAADYSSLLKVIVTAGPDEADGAIFIASAEAAKQGGLILFTIDGGANLSVVHEGLVDEFTIQTLSKAMALYLLDKTSANWAAASKYDMNGDGVIDLQDFIMIANAILDNQRIAKLRFSSDGKFKIMQMSDFQDYVNNTNKPTVHQSSIILMNAALEAEKPDLVVMTGDQLGGNMNAEALQEYIRQMVAPMEEHGVPWLVTYGNHDEDATTALSAGWNKIQQLAFYRSFAHNVNRATMSGATGFYPNGLNTYAVGDMYQLIYDNAGQTPLYNVWALDSNEYDREYSIYSNIGGDSYDWIRPKQVQWYSKTSQLLEAKYGKLNSLMFYHIPLQEWSDMWNNSAKYGVTGEKHEQECPAAVNSGLFLAALERDDVKGMFVGHDHVNTYLGNFHGIFLGYDANVGYQTYGLGGTAANNNRLRGVRVFELDKSDLSKFATRMVFASDLGVNQ